MLPKHAGACRCCGPVLTIAAAVAHGRPVFRSSHAILILFFNHACVCRCCGPVLTIAAALAHGRPVFQSPPDRRGEADAAKKALCEGSAAAKSDHLAILAAFSRFQAALSQGGHRAASQVSILVPEGERGREVGGWVLQIAASWEHPGFRKPWD